MIRLLVIPTGGMFGAKLMPANAQTPARTATQLTPYMMVGSIGHTWMSFLVLVASAVALVQQPRVSFILGPPLAGKGTQSELLVSDRSWLHSASLNVSVYLA